MTPANILRKLRYSLTPRISAHKERLSDHNSIAIDLCCQKEESEASQ